MDLDRGTLGVLVGLVSVVFGSLIILIPVAGLTARLALKPWIDRLLALMEARQSADAVQAAQTIRQLEQRVTLLEQETHSGLRQLQDLTERTEFYEGLIGPLTEEPPKPVE